MIVKVDRSAVRWLEDEVRFLRFVLGPFRRRVVLPRTEETWYPIEDLLEDLETRLPNGGPAKYVVLCSSPLEWHRDEKHLDPVVGAWIVRGESALEWTDSEAPEGLFPEERKVFVPGDGDVTISSGTRTFHRLLPAKGEDPFVACLGVSCGRSR